MRLADGSCPAHCLTQTPRPFFAEPHSSQADSPQSISSQVQDLVFALFDFHKVLFGSFLQPVWIPSLDNLPLSISTIPSTLMLPASLMRVPFVAISRLLIKTLSRTGLRIGPCSTPLLASLQVEYNPLTTTV